MLTIILIAYLICSVLSAVGYVLTEWFVYYESIKLHTVITMLLLFITGPFSLWYIMKEYLEHTLQMNFIDITIIKNKNSPFM